jgi:hypothetical protein
MTTAQRTSHAAAVRQTAIASAIIENEPGGTYRMRLFAKENQPASSLSTLAAAIGRQAPVFADVQDGQHVLVAYGLSDKQLGQLRNFLQQEHHLQPETVEERIDGSSTRLKDALRRDSMKWSGRAAFLASAAVAAAGYAQKDPDRIRTGLSFMAADSLVGIYGNGKGAIDFDALFRDMHQHFSANGIELANIATPEERRNAAGQVQNFLKRNALEINYGLGMFGGIGHIRSGLRDFARSGAGISRTTKGVLGTGGSAAVVFLDDDKDAQERLHEPTYYLTHPLEAPRAAVDFVHASPVRFKGLVSSLYTLLYLSDSFEEGKKMKLWANENGGLYNGQTLSQLKSELATVVTGGPMHAMQSEAIHRAEEITKGISELNRREAIAKTFFGGKVSPYLSAVTGVGYVIASLLAAASSKSRDHSFEQGDEYQRMYAMAAQTVLAAQPELRAGLMQQVATFLSSQKDVKNGEIDIPRIIEEVSARVDSLEQSPWLAPSHAQEQSRASPCRA